jgi:nitrate/TMAO reductase-like tetraheme cytochrome c subunit
MKLCGLLHALLLAALMPCLLPGVARAETPGEPVCIQCHSKLPEKYSQPVKLWKESIHAGNGVSCAGCHGGDPKDAANAMSPARGFRGAPKDSAVPDFCGQCHVGVLKDYLASAHGRKLGAGGPTCVTCHGSHQVVKASLGLINEKSCSRCHSYERAKIIRDAMQETEARVVAIDSRTVAYKAVGADTEKLEKDLFAVRNRFHSQFHNVNVELVKKETAQIQTELQKIEAALAKRDDAGQKRKIAGAVTVLFLLLLALILHLFKKTFDDK